MKVTINYPVQIEDETFSVRLTAEWYVRNYGIGAYEYMGSREYDAGQDVLEIENITWDDFLYTLNENEAIRKAVESIECFNAFEDEIKQIIEDNISGNL